MFRTELHVKYYIYIIFSIGLGDLLAKPWRSIQWTAEYVEICDNCYY